MIENIKFRSAFKNAISLAGWAIFSLGLIIIIVLMNCAYNQTEGNTTELLATISNVEFINKDVAIYTKEFDCTLHIYPGIRETIDLEYVTNLKEGQPIFFRMQNSMVGQLETTGDSLIVALRTDEKEIISLDDYNKYTYDDSVIPFRLTIVVAFLSILVTIYYLLRLIGIDIFSRRKL